MRRLQFGAKRQFEGSGFEEDREDILRVEEIGIYLVFCAITLEL